MKFALEVGETEKNIVEFGFNQLLGRTVIRVNRREVKKGVRLFSEPMYEEHAVDVGRQEKWQVRIKKERHQLVGAHYAVFVNNRLVNVYKGV